MSPRTLAISCVLMLVAAVFYLKSMTMRSQPFSQTESTQAPVHDATASAQEVEPPEMVVGLPEGRIVFTSYRVGNSSGLFAMGPDGSDVTSLTYGGGAACSPDGSRVACVQFFNDTGRFEIVLISPEGMFLQRLTESPDEDSTCAAWSPDGQRFAIQSGDFNKPNIYVMNADGSGRRAITPSMGNDREPCWSPDGVWIAFSSRRDGAKGVFVMDADGGQLRRLTSTESSCGDPAWSPDGRYIACVNYDRSSRSYSLRIMDAETGDWWNALQDRGLIESPSWSPAGDWLTFSMSADDNTDVYIVNILGEELRNLTNQNAADKIPCWTVSPL